MERIPICEIVDIHVSGICLQTFPCYHYLVIKLDNGKVYRTDLIFGVDIVYLHEMSSLALPDHFKVYKDCPEYAGYYTMHIDHIDKMLVIDSVNSVN